MGCVLREERWVSQWGTRLWGLGNEIRERDLGWGFRRRRSRGDEHTHRLCGEGSRCAFWFGCRCQATGDTQGWLDRGLCAPGRGPGPAATWQPERKEDWPHPCGGCSSSWWGFYMVGVLIIGWGVRAEQLRALTRRCLIYLGRHVAASLYLFNVCLLFLFFGRGRPATSGSGHYYLLSLSCRCPPPLSAAAPASAIRRRPTWGRL